MDPKLIILGLLLLFLILTWGHFKSDFGPQTWALGPEKNKYLRGFVHVLVIPFRLLASVFASGVAMLVILLLVGFVYVMWRMMHG